MRLWLVVMILAMISGCTVGPNYHHPCIPIPESFQYETAEAKETLNLEWWRFFGDRVLNELIEEALVNNKDIKIAAANIENALGILIETRAPLFPQVGYGGSYERMRISQTLATPAIGIINPQTILEGIGNASWQIDLWGRIRRLTESARANLFATYEARQQVILSLVAAVANSYIELRGLDEQLNISIRTMQSYGEAVDYFELQFKYGQSSQMAVSQALTQYETAVAKIPQIKTQIVQTENSISILLGRNPGSILRGKSISDLKLPPIPAGLPSELLCQRPDIKQAEMNLIAANAQIGAAQALYFPNISLTGNYGGASQQLGNLFSGPSNSWNFTGTVIGPIFTAGEISGQVKQARAQQLAALISYKNTIQIAFADVEDALVSQTMLVEQLEAQERLVEASGEYERLATLQFHAGYSPYFVVIQAQEQYFPSELAWAQIRVQLCSSFVNIYAAMGGGWIDIAEEGTR